MRLLNRCGFRLGWWLHLLGIVERSIDQIVAKNDAPDGAATQSFWPAGPIPCKIVTKTQEVAQAATGRLPVSTEQIDD